MAAQRAEAVEGVGAPGDPGEIAPGGVAAAQRSRVAPDRQRRRRVAACLGRAVVVHACGGGAGDHGSAAPCAGLAVGRFNAAQCPVHVERCPLARAMAASHERAAAGRRVPFAAAPDVVVSAAAAAFGRWLNVAGFKRGERRAGGFALPLAVGLPGALRASGRPKNGHVDHGGTGRRRELERAPSNRMAFPLIPAAAAARARRRRRSRCARRGRRRRGAAGRRRDVCGRRKGRRRSRRCRGPVPQSACWPGASRR